MVHYLVRHVIVGNRLAAHPTVSYARVSVSHRSVL